MGCSSHITPELEAQIITPRLTSGDLIFLDLDCGEICDAIEDVTLEQFKVAGPRLSHVGIVNVKSRGIFILEAWPEGGVHEIGLINFLSRVKGAENQTDGFYIGHFKPEYRVLALRGLKHAKNLLGNKYDEEFLVGNKKYYCSELVVEGYRMGKVQPASKSPFAFAYRPMYFGASGSSQLEIWENYYFKLGMKVPAGKPGLSPLGIYLAGRALYFE